MSAEREGPAATAQKSKAKRRQRSKLVHGRRNEQTDSHLDAIGQGVARGIHGLHSHAFSHQDGQRGLQGEEEAHIDRNEQHREQARQQVRCTY